MFKSLTLCCNYYPFMTSQKGSWCFGLGSDPGFLYFFPAFLRVFCWVFPSLRVAAPSPRQRTNGERGRGTTTRRLGFSWPPSVLRQTRIQNYHNLFMMYCLMFWAHYGFPIKLIGVTPHDYPECQLSIFICVEACKERDTTGGPNSRYEERV